MKITVLQGQTLLDVAIQHCGSAEAVFDICLENNLSVSDELSAGQSLRLSIVLKKNNEIVNYYKNKNIQPATDIATEQVNEYVFPIEVLPMIL
ncbi:hypothetical protein AB4865_07590 [Capnocytophaga sp. ARDL2]|uniref:hypothetical protein n=1 Tax=Capnocytophaga sp. ARDL2 TaxID=3238809 RepID=UPI0035582B74